MKERVLASVDRVSEGFLVLYTVEKDPDYIKEYRLKAAEYPNLDVGDFAWLEFENQYLVWVIKDEGKTKEEKEKSKGLFAALLRKKKKS